MSRKLFAAALSGRGEPCKTVIVYGDHGPEEREPVEDYYDAPQPGDGWRPIAEAPKDGSDFLVFLPNERRKIQCAWQNENGIMAIGSCFSFDLSPATHFQPLPAAPLAEGVEK